MSDDSANSGVYLRLSPSDAEERAGYRVSDLDEPLWGLGPLGRVNLFVGSTSSGKSRLMRSILRQGEYEYHAEKEHVRSTGIAMANLRGLFGSPQIPGPLRGMRLKFDNRISLNVRDSMAIGKTEYTRNHNEYTEISVNESIIQGLVNVSMPGDEVGPYRDFLRQELRLIKNVCEIAGQAKKSSVREGLKELEKLRDVLTHLEGCAKPVFDGKVPMTATAKPKPRRIYVPVLRNPNPLQNPNELDKVFAETVRQNYNIPGEVEVSTGQELYQEMTRIRNSEGYIRDRHTEFERFLGATFFAGANVDIVPIIQEPGKFLRRITIRIAGVERDLPTVGDGIQSLVILMYTLFRAEPGTHIFIEEPENSLHPGLQRIVLETMLSDRFLREKNLRIFMTTHSNHLVDLSIRNFEDASIFVFEKYPAEDSDSSKERFLIRPANNARMHAIASLEALNSSVLMANCSIWVEGVTDRLYIRAYLNAYWRSDEFKEDRKKAGQSVGAFLEDIHYAFFEYAGSNLAHYVFGNESDAGVEGVDDDKIKMQFIANRVFLIADQDAKKDGKHERLTKMAEGTEQFRYYFTQGREIENMVSESILKALLKDGFIRDPKITDDKIDGIQENEYRKRGLGEYLYHHFGQLDAAIKADSGTLTTKYKTKLAEQTSKHLSEVANGNDRNAAWRLLSAEAKALAKDIDSFIRRHNPRVSV